jgi:hypothetical protein
MIPRGTTFEFKYLGEFEIEIKNIFEHESGAHMRWIHEKNQRPKISCCCTFKKIFEGKVKIIFIESYRRIQIHVRQLGWPPGTLP